MTEKIIESTGDQSSYLDNILNTISNFKNRLLIY